MVIGQKVCREYPAHLNLIINCMNYKKILKQAIDLHVHVGPEIIPRKFTVAELIKNEKNKIKGVGIKNHFFPTTALDRPKNNFAGPFVIDSVVLNNFIGGFNTEAIRSAAELADRPIMVWFPTLHAKNCLKKQKYEIPQEWIDPEILARIKLRLAKDIEPLSIFDRCKKMKREIFSVLQTIKECNAILATGHLSWKESLCLVKIAKSKFGIEKIIITHPIYQQIKMPISVQKQVVKYGAVIEHCYSMYSIDKVPIRDIVRQIKSVGAANCILSSDVGQKFSPSPSIALRKFMELLNREGISESEIEVMLNKNPARLVG